MGAADGVDGVRFLDHTADVGIEVMADDLDELFHRAALGMLALLRGEEDTGSRPAPDGGHAVPVFGEGRDRAMVLAAWLRELLFLHEPEGLDYRGAEFSRIDPSGFEATVRVGPATGAVREIKGVTYHELAVRETETGWQARVIFDV